MRPTLLGVFAIGVVLTLAAACGGGDDENVVKVAATEFSYDMPGTAEAGVITFDLDNTGDLVHEFAFGRMDPGHTEEEVAELFESEPSEPPDWIEDFAGVPPVSPNTAVKLTRELPAGTYVWICAIPDAEGTPHSSNGMVKMFEVTGESSAKLPTPDAVIEATDDSFVVPDLEGGTQLIELRNSASEPREFFILSFEEGKTEEDLGAWFESGLEGDAPALLPGGMQTIPPGTSVFLEFELVSGRTYQLSSGTESGDQIVEEFTPS